MIEKEWLKLDYDGKTGIAKLTVYPSHRPFTRVVNVAQELPGGWPTDPSEVGLNAEISSLAVWTSRPEGRIVDFYLPDILWTGKR